MSKEYETPNLGFNFRNPDARKNDLKMLKWKGDIIRKYRFNISALDFYLHYYGAP